MQQRYVWLLAVVAVVCAGWTGVWFYAAGYAGKVIDRALAREAAVGRRWTCAGREIGGFPFRFAVRCSSLRFAGPTPRGPADADLGPVRAMVQIYNPKLVLAEADGPVRVKLPGRISQVTASFAALRASFRAARPFPERVSVRTEKLKAEIALAQGDMQRVELDSAEFHLRPAPDVVADVGAVDLAFSLRALSSALVDRLSGIAAPVDAEVTVRVTRAPALLTGRRKPNLENWQRAEGVMTVQKSTVSKGPLQVEASGKLHIDDERRLAGALNTRTAGAGSLLQRFGLGGGRTAMSGLLGGLLGTARAADAPKRKKLFLPLPLTLRDGFVWVGPIRTKLRLPPLY